MPLTNFPNGVTTQVASAQNASAGAGDLNAIDVFVDGSATIVGSVIGETIALQHTFGTASTAETAFLACPVNGNIVAGMVAVGVTATLTTGYTVRVNSAGTVAIATVANTSGSSGTQTSLTTTVVAVTTADSISVLRAAQGTTGNTSITVLVKRTS